MDNGEFSPPAAPIPARPFGATGSGPVGMPETTRDYTHVPCGLLVTVSLRRCDRAVRPFAARGSLPRQSSGP
jgi:hypothetical protein